MSRPVKLLTLGTAISHGLAATQVELRLALNLRFTACVAGEGTLFPVLLPFGLVHSLDHRREVGARHLIDHRRI